MKKNYIAFVFAIVLFANTYATTVKADFLATEVCLNNPTTFSDVSVGATSWQWNFGEPSAGGSNLSTNQNPVHIYPTAGCYTVTLVASDGTTNDTAYKTVCVSPLPLAAFTTVDVCAGTETCFTDLSTLVVGQIVSWQWNFGDGTFYTTQNPCHTYYAPGTYTISLEVTSDKGCSDITTLNTSAFPLPLVYFSASDTSGCVPQCVNFSDQSTILQGNIVDWAWDFGTGGFTSNLQNPLLCFQNPGIYDIKLTVVSDKGCKDSLVKTNYIQANENPVAGFTFVHNGGASFSFTDTSSGSPTIWYWSFMSLDTVYSVLQNPDYLTQLIPDVGVDACLFVTNASGCTGSFCKTIIESGINENNLSNAIEVFQNANKSIQLVYNSNTKQQLNIKVIDVLGREVYNTNRSFINGDQVLINASNFDPGLYKVILASDDAQCVKSVVVGM